MIELPETALSDIVGLITELFSDLSGLVALIIAIPLGFWIITLLIEAVAKAKAYMEWRAGASTRQAIALHEKFESVMSGKITKLSK